MCLVSLLLVNKLGAMGGTGAPVHSEVHCHLPETKPFM